MTLLVTGASGHVGREIVRRASGRGLDVVAVHHTTEPDSAARALGPRVRWEKCELEDLEAVAALGQAVKATACIHGAAISNEAYARPNPLKALATNVGATANLLECARRQEWRRFIFVSTGSVFQNRSDLVSPIPEDAPLEPGNIYGTTKANAELVTRMYRTQFDVPAATVRISWVYGPPVITDSPARGPIPSYLMRALRGEAIREGGADFAAMFTYVADVADGLIAAATAAELRHHTYHLGPGVNFTARQVAAALRQACPDADIELGPGTDPWTRYTALRGPLAGTRLRDDTGFVTAHSLDQGVVLYADWMRDALKR
jgi:nucleoside-diphosphate-sugar epimerase